MINETYSSFLQGFMPSRSRPDVDVLEGLTTAIIVNQEPMGANVRSTVGTVTDVDAMLRILFARLGERQVGPPQVFSFNVASTSGSGFATVMRKDGADEVDMVINIAAAIEGSYNSVQADIAAVRASVPEDRILKVIIESAALSDEAIVGACKATAAAGADFVKTSAGFHGTGGASEHAVALMAETVGGTLGVKASGGIRTADAALAMITAGATRLGLSGTRAVLDGLDGTSSASDSGDGY